jgi:hypothetical protein
MKPSLVWSTPRPRLRRTLEFALTMVVAGCCHPAAEPAPPPIKYELAPSTAAKEALVKNVLDKLEGKAIPGKASMMGQLLSKTLTERPPQDRGADKQNPSWEKADRFSDLVTEFNQNLVCKDDGCYSELTAGSGEKAVRINQFVTDFTTPLKRWSGWRFVSGMYEGSAIDAKANDQQRRMAVVVLKGRPWGRQ